MRWIAIISVGLAMSALASRRRSGAADSRGPGEGRDARRSSSRTARTSHRVKAACLRVSTPSRTSSRRAATMRSTMRRAGSTTRSRRSPMEPPNARATSRSTVRLSRPARVASSNASEKQGAKLSKRCRQGMKDIGLD